MADVFAVFILFIILMGMLATFYQVAKYIKRTDYVLKRLEDIYGSYVEEENK